MTKSAKYMMSTGDEAGSALGVMSNKVKGVCEYMMYSFDVKFEGKNVCRLGDPLFHNEKNGLTMEVGEPVAVKLLTTTSSVDFKDCEWMCTTSQSGPHPEKRHRESPPYPKGGTAARDEEAPKSWKKAGLVPWLHPCKDDGVNSFHLDSEYHQNRHNKQGNAAEQGITRTHLRNRRTSLHQLRSVFGGQLSRPREKRPAPGL